MKQSAQQQGLIDKGWCMGFAQGCASGFIQGGQHFVTLLGTTKFGPPSETVLYRLENISDSAELERLALALLTASTWTELLRARRPARTRRR